MTTKSTSKKQLSPTSKKLLGVAAAVEFAAKVCMWVDLAKRPADQVKGPKWAWVLGSFVNTIGSVAYFTVGRRKPTDD
ncbi:PLD nuclease N-terminal domain-containing protein [Propionibacteriaceae bacterium G1746]